MGSDAKRTIDPGVSNLASDNWQLEVGCLGNEQLKVGVQGGHLNIRLGEISGCGVEEVDHLGSNKTSYCRYNTMQQNIRCRLCCCT